MKNFHIKSLPESRHVHYELGTNRVFHDINIYTDDPEPKLTISKLLLSAFSPLLKKEFSEADDTDIIFSGYTVMDIQLFLQFIMTGKCVVQNEKTLGALTDLFYDLQFQGEISMEDFVQSRDSGNSQCIRNLSETKDLSSVDKTQLEDMFEDAIAEMFFDEEQNCVTEDVKQDHEILCKEEEKMDEEAIQQEVNRVDSDGVPRKHGILEKLKGQISVEDVIKEDVSLELQIKEEETFDGETKNEQEENSFKSEDPDMFSQEEENIVVEASKQENWDNTDDILKGHCIKIEKLRKENSSDVPKEIRKSDILLDEKTDSSHEDVDVETVEEDWDSHSPSIEYETVYHKRVSIYFACPEPKCQSKKKIFGRWNLMMHMKEHLGDVASECVTCRIQITSPLVLKKHNDRHETEPYEVKEVICSPITKQCKHCGKCITGLYEFVYHMVDHVGQKALECEFCGKLYEERMKWLNHHRRHKCDICGMKYKDVLSHKRSVHPENSCQICSKHFFHLKYHMRKHRETIKPKPKQPGKVCCEDCGKIMSREALKIHKMVHHGVEKPFACSSCEKSYVSSVDLKEHIAQVHTAERNFPCSDCEYKCSSSRKLKAHRRSTHSGTRFLCKICNATVKRAIKDHMILHTDVKPFQCRFCGLLFKHKTGAGRHVHKFHGEKGGVKILMPKNIEDMISKSVEIVKDNEADGKEIQKKKQDNAK